jgi:hypothetical protein
VKAVITQPNYLPWLGYFEMVDAVDLWVSLDNVQRSRQSHHVRNRIRSPEGAITWLNAGVEKGKLADLLSETRLRRQPWWREQLALVARYYRDAPHLAELLPALRGLLEPRADESYLSAYSTRVIRELADMLGVGCRIVMASTIPVPPNPGPQERVIAICRALGIRELHNPRRGIEAGLYDARAFADEGIRLLKQEYRHPTYRQLGTGFVPYLSVIDLLLNELPAARDIVLSGRNWVELTGAPALSE